MKSVVVSVSCFVLLAPALVADSLEAYHGQPFGVARLTLSQPANGARRTGLSTSRLAGRLMRDPRSAMRFPVMERSGLVSDSDADGTLHSIYFLFDDADSLAFQLKLGQKLKTTVQTDPQIATKFLDRWWKLYVAQAKTNTSSGKSPHDLEQYLVSLLARRYGRATPRLPLPRDYRADNVDDVIAILTGAESLQLAMQKDSLLDSGGKVVKAALPVPPGVAPPPVEIPEVEGAVEIESLATVVPQECYYARFESFEDFQWFRARMGEWGTDLRGLVSASSMDYAIADRLQHQLQLFDEDMATLLESHPLEDLAVIGSDTLFGQGAGIGFVFQPTESGAFQDKMLSLRKQKAADSQAVSFESFRLAGYDSNISLLSTTDNSVRSYYAVVGDHHLVTTSQYILQRFLEVATNGVGSLGGTKEFRFARSLHPASKPQAVFLHLSDPFFRNLVDPAFRIEMTRRARFQTEARQYHLAAMAARSEGVTFDSLDDLRDAGFLTPSFGIYPDGSTMKLVDGQPVNTVRGAAGTMIPVADVSVRTATPREVEGYEAFSVKYRRIWARMDPATIGIAREETDGVEHISMDLHVFPVPAQEYGMINMVLAPPTAKRLSLPPSCLLLLEGDIRFIMEGRAFAGVLDQDIPFQVTKGKVEPVTSALDQHPAFVGGSEGILKLVGSRVADVGVGEYFRSDTIFRDAWGYRSEEYVVEAASKDNIHLVLPHLHVQESARPSQLRLHVGDLSAARMLKFVNAMAWQRTKQIADANEFLPDRLAEQLHVHPSQAWDVTRQVLGGTPVCPFGGEYRLIQRAGGVEADAWRSTEAPDWNEFRLPIFDHVRGAEVELSISRTTLTTHAEIWLGR